MVAELARAQAPTSPGPRTGAYMAYDSKRALTLLFGGWTRGADGSPAYPDDLWGWDGSQWRLLPRPVDSPHPVGRDVPVVVYDAARDRLVVFGGRGPSADPSSLADVWEWDGARWHRTGGNGFPRVLHPAAAYDAARKRVIVFGGGVVDSTGRFAGLSRTLWEWDGVRWIARDTSGPADRIPGGLVAAPSGIIAMTDHPGDNRDSARIPSVVWARSEAGWVPREHGPAFNNLQAVAGAPDGTFYFLQSWESWLTTPVLHVRDTNGTWRHIESDMNPGVRNTAAAAWDSKRGRFVVYGGQSREGRLLADTWEYDGHSWVKR